ncbi:hypothetical protein GTW56_14195 [Bacillus sp. EB93]|nr:hypothetical protein [Peribacillus frigoritolerans]
MLSNPDFTQSFTDFQMKAQTGHSSFRVKASHYESDQGDDPPLTAQLADKAQPISVSILDYGAVGDGITPVDIAFNSAKVKKNVFFPQNTAKNAVY